MKTPMMILLGVVALCLFAEEARAIPAFARKYDMSCTTCHAPFPKLKPYGDEFAANGFQLADKDAPRFTRNTGDDELLLMRELPVAVRLEGYSRWQPETADRTDFQWPYVVKLLSGGQIARNVSYYFYFFFGERGEVAGLEDAFIMFNNLFHTDLDIYLGQFQVSDPLFKRELRLTLEDYAIYDAKPGFSEVNLTYDRGVMLTYGFPTKTDVVVEVLNGSGISPADPFRNFDTDKYKNFALRISQDVTEGFRLGGFGYYGKEEQGGVVNTMTMFGPDITVGNDQVEFNVQYIERKDDDPLFGHAGKKTTTRGAFAEFVYTPEAERSTWYGVALFNWMESDLSSLRYRSMTGHVGYMVARNLRLIGEYTFDLEEEANKLTVGFVCAF